MRRKIFITIFIIIFIFQAIIPIKVNAEPNSEETATEETEIEDETGEEMQIIPTQPKQTIFSPDITWEWVYEEGEYGLFVPSNADTIGNAPMIVWLHGNGDGLNGSESGLLSEPVPSLFKNWNMEGFSAFILCPQSRASWDNHAVKPLTDLIDKILQEYPIDPSNVVIMGHSAGAKGALQMAVNIPEYFSKAVVMSGYWVSGLSSITLPTKCYVGTSDTQTCKTHMSVHLEPTFGIDNCYWMGGATHNTVTKAAFYEDST